MEAQASSAVNTEQEFNPENCWFCKVSKAPKIDPHIKVDMFRRGPLLGEEKDAKGVKVQKYQWDTIKFPVPRCEECAHAHNASPTIRTGPTLLVLIVYFAFVYNIYGKHGFQDGMEFYIEATIYAGFGFLAAEIYSRWALKRLKKNVPDTKYSRHYPVLEKLVTDGWVVGTSPAGKGGADAKAQVSQKQGSSKYFPSA